MNIVIPDDYQDVVHKLACFELLRGRLNAAEHAHEVARVRKYLSESAAEHLREFAAAWPET